MTVRLVTPDELPAVIRRNVVVNSATSCWEWGGSIDRYGYSQAWRSKDGAKVKVHRWAYHLAHPDFKVVDTETDVTLDHLCNNRRCVNPAHLEPTTRSENSTRANEYRWQGITRHPSTKERDQ